MQGAKRIYCDSRIGKRYWEVVRRFLPGHASRIIRSSILGRGLTGSVVAVKWDVVPGVIAGTWPSDLTSWRKSCAYVRPG